MGAGDSAQAEAERCLAAADTHEREPARVGATVRRFAEAR